MEKKSGMLQEGQLIYAESKNQAALFLKSSVTDIRPMEKSEFYLNDGVATNKYCWKLVDISVIPIAL